MKSTNMFNLKILYHTEYGKGDIISVIMYVSSYVQLPESLEITQLLDFSIILIMYCKQ